MDIETMKRVKRNYHQAHDAVVDVVLDALCTTYKEVTGKEAGDRLREELYQAIRFDC